MLRLDKITKVYPLKDNPVHALKGITLNFRKNEFVSILGPSGCGKTTTLNIIGGLDHYTDGDLIINGVSTKKFGDRDWDVYRNHKIGFIFQAYNLIPHETILENVELALTIGGVGKEERVERAKKALDSVGLKDMYNKHANQLSGGQCQRVAIARALVNEPDILLADEPTGALDSVTSVQIMDLIKRISKEKLVIMVTHNPDLAQKYSTRIIELLDGEVKSDSNPYSLEDEEKERAVAEKVDPKAKAKMSWWTAFKLSAKNLWSKLKRTSLVVVASSIGIVGVSAVLAVSQGVTGYIDGMQDDMLSGNPITISESGLDLSSLVSSMSTSTTSNIVAHSYKDGKIDIQFMVEQLIKTAKTMTSAKVSNAITEAYEAFVKDMPSTYYADIAMKYGINVKNNIYTTCDVHLSEHEDDDLYSLSGISTFAQNILENINNGDYASYASMVDSYTDSIGQCLDNEEYVLSQYDIVTGHYAREADEVMLVLNHNNEITEFILTFLGYYSQDEFANAMYHFAGETEKVDEEMWKRQQSIDWSTLLNHKFIYYPNDTIYTKNPAYGTKSYDEDTTCYQPYFYDYLADPTWNTGTELKVVGILTPKSDTNYGSLDAGLYYTSKFTEKYLLDNMLSEFTVFLRDYLSQESTKSSSGYSSMVLSTDFSGITVTMIRGVGYEFQLLFEDKWIHGYGLIGEQNSLSTLFSSMIGGSGSSGGGTTTGGLSIKKSATVTLRDTGGNDLPSKISIYPKSFEKKYLVTDYLDKWNQGNDITLTNGRVITKAEQTEIKYTDNLQVIISMINGVINIVTIALICFTALSLVVSTVMIGIITYVSVMERVKEIGVIRSLGGRKNDVSHLFNAETFMIGAASGIFGLAITYLIELILNLTIGQIYKVGMIANLNWWSALIVFAISILLTVIAGLIPSRAAAKQDPVVALRSE